MEIPLLCLMCEAKLSLCMVFSFLVLRVYYLLMDVPQESLLDL